MAHALFSTCICLLIIASAWSADVTIKIDETHQTIEGFGTCLYPMGKPAKWYPTVDLPKLYVDELGASCLRVNIRSHNIPKQEDPAKLSHEDMQLSKRAGIFAHEVKRMVEAYPDLRLIATAWTPPAWMKVNNSESGYAYKRGVRKQESGAIDGRSYHVRGEKHDNRVDPKYFPHLAAWCVEVIRFYQDMGVKNIYAISFGNEVCFSQYFGRCVWTADDYAEALRHVGEGLEQAGLGHVKIFGPEIMSKRDYRSDMYLAAMKKAGSLQYLDALATHGYTDGVHEDTSATSTGKQKVIAEKYNKAFWITEGGTGDHDWPAPLQEGIGGALHNALVHGNASLFTPWQFAGKASHHNLRPFDAPSKKTYVAMQFMRFIKPGMQRVSINNDDNQLLCSAYRNDAGLRTVVLMNISKQDKQIDLDGLDRIDTCTIYRTSNDHDFAMERGPAIRRGTLALSMPALSVATIVCE